MHLGILPKTLKRVCQKLNIGRWPQRKLSSLVYLREEVQKDVKLPANERKVSDPVMPSCMLAMSPCILATASHAAMPPCMVSLMSHEWVEWVPYGRYPVRYMHVAP